MKMARHIAGLVTLALAATPAVAGGEGASDGFASVEVSAELCAHIATYVPTGDADYKPGVAVDGHSVAPADVDAPLETRELYSFPVKVAPLNGSGKYAADSTLEVATVTFDPRTGIVLVDGQQVTGAERSLADACAHRSEKSGD